MVSWRRISPVVASMTRTSRSSMSMMMGVPWRWRPSPMSCISPWMRRETLPWPSRDACPQQLGRRCVPGIVQPDRRETDSGNRLPPPPRDRLRMSRDAEGVHEHETAITPRRTGGGQASAHATRCVRALLGRSVLTPVQPTRTERWRRVRELRRERSRERMSEPAGSLSLHEAWGEQMTTGRWLR